MFQQHYNRHEMSAVNLDDLPDSKAVWILFKRKCKWLLQKYANFLRIHITYFVVMIFIGSGIFYGIEGGRYDYVDSLFTMTSAMTTTGLMSVDPSQLSIGSQVLIVIYIWIGSFVWNSLLPLLFRIRYFREGIKRSGAFVQKDGKKLIHPSIVLTGDARLEYLSIIYVIRIVLIYLASLLVTCYLFLAIYFWSSEFGRSVLAERNVNMYWFIGFLTVSANTDAGIIMLSDSLMAFQKSPAILLILSFYILAALTAFPIALRIIVIILRRISPTNEIYHYMLTHPRQIYTLLFPRHQTRWLFITLVVLNSVQLVTFELIAFNKPMLAGLNQIEKIVNGIFQTLSTRTAGFNSVDLSLSSEALRIMWIVVMYIAAYPVTLSIRTSRVRRPRKQAAPKTRVTPPLAIGSAVRATVDKKLKSPPDIGDLADHVRPSISRDDRAGDSNRTILRRSGMVRTQSLDPISRRKEKLDPDEDPNDRPVYITSKSLGRSSNFTNQVKNIVLRDVSWLVIAWFIISLIENDRVSFPGDIYFTESKVLFEIISAFGNVGLSLGYPNAPTSFVGVWHAGSKLVLIVVMLLGRHRGLPNSIDRAIMGMSPRSMKRSQGGAAALAGAGLHPEHSAQVRGAPPNEVPLSDMSPPEHVINIEDHPDSGNEGLAERVINKLDFLKPSEPTHEVLSEGEPVFRSDGEKLVAFVADPKVLGLVPPKPDNKQDVDRADEDGDAEEHHDEDAEESGEDDNVDDSDEEQDNEEDDNDKTNEKEEKKND